MIHLVTRNLGWKLTSLGIAILLWLAVVGDPELTTTISAPVEFRNAPRGLEISSDVPERLHLEVSGASGRLSPVRLADCRAIIDLHSVDHPGERTFTINQASVTLPAGVTLQRASPSQVRLIFEPGASRTVAVRARHGNPPQGYRIVRVDVTPAHLHIAGPESHVRRIESVETDLIDLSSVISESTFTVHAYVADPEVRFQDPNLVQVKVSLEPARRPEN